MPEFPSAELLKFEKEYLGFYISSHPLTEHQSAIEHVITTTARVGHVSDAQLRWLYANCRAVVSASHEDFGLTPLEGLVMGTRSGDVDPALILHLRRMLNRRRN